MNSDYLLLISSPVGMHVPTHFQYVDDMLLFCQASAQNLRVVLDAFEFYGSLSGQYVNWEKSSLYFGRGISEAKIINFLSISSMKRSGDFMTYLEVPLFIRVSRL